MSFLTFKLLYPQALLAWPAILLFLWWSHRGRTARRRSLGFSNLMLVEWSKSAVPLRLSRRTEILHALFWALLLLTLARPQQSLGEKPQTKEGIDILLCLDTSQSMEADDLLLWSHARTTASAWWSSPELRSPSALSPPTTPPSNPLSKP
jgi:Ca-activated chloride channel family protein